MMARAALFPNSAHSVTFQLMPYAYKKIHGKVKEKKKRKFTCMI